MLVQTRGGRARVTQANGCDREPDMLPGEGGGQSCADCRTYQTECRERPEAHGRFRVGEGKRGLCFRTNACPRCVWAAMPGVREVVDAYWWAADEKVRALAPMRLGNPPAVLLDAVGFYASERNRCDRVDHERRMKELEKSDR